MQIIRQKGSNLCWQSNTTSPSDNDHVVLADGCDKANNTNTRFKVLPKGQLLHVNSGKCVHPFTGEPTAGKELVFWEPCSPEQVYTLHPPGGMLGYRESGLCVHPKENTGSGLLALREDCTAKSADARFQFEMWKGAASPGEG